MDELTIECKERLAKTVESFKGDLTTLRTGRATPAMLDRIECEYYGDRIAINQISSVSVPEPRQLLIKPYDKGDLKSIVAAIASSDLGINPINDGDSIRLIIPALTEDTRRDLVKKAKAKCEEAKIAIRNIRREYNDFIKESDEMTDDYKKRVQEEIQKVVDEASKNLEDILANKEKEIMAI
ncbi:MAG: ribosome recycling factor [Bacillales bacterium]|nr:ribosome recycling factor [Bacillales bacterium]MDY6002921.1 ribosome recycling factor [Bacilli bacterium]